MARGASVQSRSSGGSLLGMVSSMGKVSSQASQWRLTSDDLAVLLVVDGEGKLALAEGADEDIEQAAFHGLQDSYSVRSSISKSTVEQVGQEEDRDSQDYERIVPRHGGDYFSPKSGRETRASFIDGIEDSRVTSAVADEGEHPEGQDDLDTEGRGVWRLDLGESVEGEDGAGGDEDDDAGYVDGAELDADGGRQGTWNVRDALQRWDEDDEVEEAPADPCGSGQRHGAIA